jgi:hypothetical protein
MAKVSVLGLSFLGALLPGISGSPVGKQRNGEFFTENFTIFLFSLISGNLFSEISGILLENNVFLVSNFFNSYRGQLGNPTVQE